MDRWLGPNEDRSHDVLAGALSLTQYEAPPLVPRGSSLNTTGLIVHLCSYWSTGLLVVTRAFNIHRHISKGPSFLFGLRFRSNYHFRKHVSLRPFTSSVVRGPYAWGPWDSRGILGSLGSPRGYASDQDARTLQVLGLCDPPSFQHFLQRVERTYTALIRDVTSLWPIRSPELIKTFLPFSCVSIYIRQLFIVDEIRQITSFQMIYNIMHIKNQSPALFAVFWAPLSKICYNILSAVPPTHFTTL